MAFRLRVVADNAPVSSEVSLPTRGRTFDLSATGARQLAAHLERLADLCDDADGDNSVELGK